AHAKQVAILPAPCEAVGLWHAQAHEWLLQSNNRFWIGIKDDEYPARLLDLKDPPLILFGEGNRDLLNCRAVAMVGSRNATRAGIGNANGFAQAICKAGWVVISGLAEGIDGAAHAGALHAGGGTIAVLGCGPDQVYPKHHAGLRKHILDSHGLVLSEYPPGTAPQPAFFPRRNRIIAALSDALLVVEAAMRSGSLITARVASQLGRPVAAIPGSIHSSQSKGCHDMIKKGAMLVETAQELLEEARATLPDSKIEYGTAGTPGAALGAPVTEEASQADLTPDMKRILTMLDTTAQHADLLGQEAGLGADETLAALTELELLGLALGESGNRWLRANGVF
ncbi:MAG TPA: DNA-processing protein DprA, partial [Limnobacter sp.]|nr:DNA-processing protein DprA [Limnobacter sp.]